MILVSDTCQWASIYHKKVKLLLKFLDETSAKAWEAVGIGFGLVACLAIAVQLYHESITEAPSSLSWFHLIGFACVYLFWFFYGLRFRHIGVWLPNAIAAALQTILLITIASKSLV